MLRLNKKFVLSASTAVMGYKDSLNEARGQCVNDLPKKNIALQNDCQRGSPRRKGTRSGKKSE